MSGIGDTHVKLQIIPKSHVHVTRQLYMANCSWGIMMLLAWAPMAGNSDNKGEGRVGHEDREV